jgi:hypothetical protein
MKKLSICFFALAVLVATAKMKPTSLTGTWRVTELKTTGPNAGTNSNPQPGLLIFTGNHYSLMTINSQTPRPAIALQDLANATAAQLQASWGPFTANSGTYEVSGGNLTFRPEVAKNPGAMAPGAANVSSFRIEGNKLTLIQVRNVNGPVANPITTTLTRIE